LHSLYHFNQDFMAKNRNRQRYAPTPPTPFEQARDELLQHIMRCGVIDAATEHQAEWFDDTMAYLAERFPELKAPEVAELRTLGQRFCEPPKARATAESSAA
jgi:hypothetical protein